MSEITLNDERGLLSRVARGDESAFEQLFNIYHQHLSNYVLRITESREMTEEIVLDVFLKIWLNRESLFEVNNFKSYLFAASKNHTLNAIKKLIKERAVEKELEEGIVSIPPHIDSETHNPQHILFDEAVDQLPSQQKKVYLMSRHERMKYAEIAQETGISKETVKKYLQLATASITAYVRANMKRIATFFYFYFFFCS